mmetsp:Transcript_144361/g.402204  ORF Transcript_144361/g.402204 Transcript_144361/m.402204 type:complete len:92 (+) Transcript_144361:28-303(+)
MEHTASHAEMAHNGKGSSSRVCEEQLARSMQRWGYTLTLSELRVGRQPSDLLLVFVVGPSQNGDNDNEQDATNDHTTVVRPVLPFVVVIIS